MSNKSIYESGDIVSVYAKETGLQPAEETIINQLRDKLSNMKVLDIGIGAGRTTACLADYVKDYVGIDNSENMVKFCEKRFDGFQANLSFKVCDVRSMDIFEDNFFDFVLFSYNGIDCIPYGDRATALQEIQRVSKPGGFFCFSTHNFRYIDHLKRFTIGKNPLRFIRLIVRYLHSQYIVWQRNRNKGIKHAIIRDGGDDFRLKTCYVEPLEQIKKLEGIGFQNIRIFSEKTGNELEDISNIDGMKDDRWLYYVCNA